MVKEKFVLTQKYLKEILNYDPLTGVFTWNVNRIANKIKGQIAGTLDKDGYRQIGINSKVYKAHQLAWLYVYGYLPKEIDHIHGIKDDNRISELREATSSQNKCNKPKRKDNTSGFKGVTWHKGAKKWMTQIGINKRSYFLGYFDTPEKAALAFNKAAIELHGEFASLNKVFV
jgi:HNH endonuclease/AP2 domain